MLILIFNINHESVEMLFLWKKVQKDPHGRNSINLQVLIYRF